jgi:hypothetical protein
MSCADALELVEPVAAADLPMDPAARAHFETCPGCAGALASARRVEAMLRAVETPPAPPAFSGIVLQRIRRERWRSEQQVDRLFNIAIVLAVVLVAGSIAAMLNAQTVFDVSRSAWLLLKGSARSAVAEAAPTLPTYVAAAGLLVSALAMWWWAERKMGY